MKVKKILKEKSGMSLMEVIVAISITVVLLGVITTVYVMGVRSFEAEFIKSNLQTETRTVVDRMADDIKLATSVQGTLNDPINGQQYNSGSNTLILQVLAVDTNNNILYDKYDYFIYIIDTSSRRINKRTLPHVDSARTVSTKIFLDGLVISPSSFSYAPQSPPSINITEVTIDLKVLKTARNKNYSYTITQTTKLRNK